MKTRQQAFLQHTLDSNELLILCARLQQLRPDITVAAMRTEHELKREPVRVRTKGSSRQAVIPDAWVELRTPRQFCIAFELDRGTEFKKPIAAKIAGYLQYEKGPYQEAFGTDLLTVAFVVTRGGERRVNELVRWTEKVLSDANAKEAADLFRFGVFEPATSDPVEVFFTPLWRKPFEPSPVPLL